MGGKHIFPKDLGGGGGEFMVDQKINSFFLCCVGHVQKLQTILNLIMNISIPVAFYRNCSILYTCIIEICKPFNER